MIDVTLLIIVQSQVVRSNQPNIANSAKEKLEEEEEEEREFNLTG